MLFSDRVAVDVEKYGGLFLKLDEILGTVFQEVLPPYDLFKLLKDQQVSFTVVPKLYFPEDVKDDYSVRFNYYGMNNSNDIYSFTIILYTVVLSVLVLKVENHYAFRTSCNNEVELNDAERRKLIILSVLSIRKLLYEQYPNS